MQRKPAGLLRPTSEGSQELTDEERLLEQENERRLNELSAKVSAIKEVTHQISSSVRSGIRDVESLETDMSGSRLTLSGATQQIKQLFHVASSKHMLYLILFIFGVFVVLYFLIRIYRAHHSSS